ncbi:hypothetical protein OMAG_002298 [Candidatus Omnitrophus magneticus]|uniref:Uncharacterized protein n=1 Tax=Candidatus Omnitrophus magneticus TaxID=1609969 RepID=A0A0F0CP95_9BACT|nr:hypothetical protein OMAG_002298 [Candidatus Omnitrophus magneticus]
MWFILVIFIKIFFTFCFTLVFWLEQKYCCAIMTKSFFLIFCRIIENRKIKIRAENIIKPFCHSRFRGNDKRGPIPAFRGCVTTSIAF